jgi:hypothetical protein
MRSVISPVFRRTLPWDPDRDKTGAIGSRTMPSPLEISSLFVLGDSDDRFDAPKKLNQEHHETLPFVPRGNHREHRDFCPFRRSPDRHPGRSASARAGFLDLVVCDFHPSIVSLHSCNTVFVSDLARRRPATTHPNGRTPSTRTLGTGTGVTLEPGFPSFFPGSGVATDGCPTSSSDSVLVARRQKDI